jgi:hypothetical protein
MTKIESVFNEVLQWHKQFGLNIRKQKEKRDCLGNLIDERDQAYYDLIDYYSSKSDFSALEIEFLLYCQNMWLLEFTEANSLFKRTTDLEIDFLKTEDKIIQENHFLSRFSRNQRLAYYQRKNFLEVNCCYRKSGVGKYYIGRYSISNKSLFSPQTLILTKLSEKSELKFEGFFKLGSNNEEIPIFNIRDNDGLALFKEIKRNGVRQVVMIREDFEKINEFGNYQATNNCPVYIIDKSIKQ